MSDKQEWISVSDKLPHINKKYLVIFDNIEIEHCIGLSSFFTETQEFNHTNITHWMPLPSLSCIAIPDSEISNAPQLNQEPANAPSEIDISILFDTTMKRMNLIEKKLEAKTWQGYEDCRKACSELKQEFERGDNARIELLNKIADLSFRINKMQSDLREFEKQKVEPIHVTIAFLMQHIEKLEQINNPEFIDNAQRNYEIVRNKIDNSVKKLEKHDDELFEMISSSDYRINNIFEHIERLESNNSTNTTLGMSRFKSIEDRIEKLGSLSVRLSELEEWTRKDEDRIYEHIKHLCDRAEAIENNLKIINNSRSRPFNIQEHKE